MGVQTAIETAFSTLAGSCPNFSMISLGAIPFIDFRRMSILSTEILMHPVSGIFGHDISLFLVGPTSAPSALGFVLAFSALSLEKFP